MSVYKWMRTLDYKDIVNRWDMQTCLIFLRHSTKMQKGIQGVKGMNPALVREEVVSRATRIIEQRPPGRTLPHPNRPVEVLMINTLNHQIANIGCLFPMYTMPPQMQLQDDDDFHNALLQLQTFMAWLNNVTHQIVASSKTSTSDAQAGQLYPLISLPSP
jgi:hypothetical protein